MVEVSNAELHVMQVLWKHSPQSAQEIVAQLQQEFDWHEKNHQNHAESVNPKASDNLYQTRSQLPVLACSFAASLSATSKSKFRATAVCWQGHAPRRSLC